MSDSPEKGFDLDLHFLPAWAQQAPDLNRYAKFEGGDGDRGRRGRRPDRRGDQRGDPRGRSRDPRSGPSQQRPQRGHGRDRDRDRDRDRGPRQRREEQIQLPEVNVMLIPEDKGVESLARQIRLTGRAYPIFEVAALILKKPERFHVHFSVIKKSGGQPAQSLFACNLDNTVWLSEEEAVRHIFKHHFDTFYQTEKIPTDPPKGTYTFVAQCGISGEILGPPNYHDYQNKLRKLHAQRFSNMAFDHYKSRVRIVKDEEIVKKWLEDQSFRHEYNCLNVPEPKKLNTMAEVEQHFRETHLPNIVRSVDSFTLTDMASRNLLPAPLQALCRRLLDEQRRFPLKVVNKLSQQFAGHGLQFFKVNKTFTHVAVARPHFLDLAATPVSAGVKRIVEFIDAKPGTNRKDLIEHLAPTPATGAATAAPEAPAATVESVPAAEGTDAATDKAEGGPVEGAPAEAATPTEPTPKAPVSPDKGKTADAVEPTAEQAAVISDLHWLIHQGHVIEFANGKLETAKKPVPKPPAREPKAPKPRVKPATDSKTGTKAGTPETTGAPTATTGKPESETGAASLRAEADASPTTPGSDASGATSTSEPVPTAQSNGEQTAAEPNETPDASSTGTQSAQTVEPTPDPDSTRSEQGPEPERTSPPAPAAEATPEPQANGESTVQNEGETALAPPTQPTHPTESSAGSEPESPPSSASPGSSDDKPV